MFCDSCINKNIRTFAEVKVAIITETTKQKKHKMTANEALHNYLCSLPPRERIAKSRDIRELGRIEQYQLSNWRRGRAKINPQWQRKLSEIIGEDIFADVDN